MSDDSPRCVCSHVSSVHFRSVLHPEKPLGLCVIGRCPCQEFEDEMEEIDA